MNGSGRGLPSPIQKSPPPSIANPGPCELSTTSTPNGSSARSYEGAAAPYVAYSQGQVVDEGTRHGQRHAPHRKARSSWRSFADGLDQTRVLARLPGVARARARARARRARARARAPAAGPRCAARRARRSTRPRPRRRGWTTARLDDDHLHATRVARRRDEAQSASRRAGTRPCRPARSARRARRPTHGSCSHPRCVRPRAPAVGRCHRPTGEEVVATAVVEVQVRVDDDVDAREVEVLRAEGRMRGSRSATAGCSSVMPVSTSTRASGWSMMCT